jgi:ABC-type multidrug transport system fused ATPase/permease subunit
VVERGHHDELLAARGLYASLYREQLVAEALAAS